MSLLAAVSILAAQALPPVPASSVDYSKTATWLCLPGRKDPCSTPFDITELRPNGYGARVTSAPAKDPPVDCFFVYPTVSDDRGMNSDLLPGAGERRTAQNLFARFASVCRPYAPMYRQMTLASIAAAATGSLRAEPALIAFSDVRKAFRTYLSAYNQGRPFVLVGHSQGSLMLEQLIVRDIEPSPALARQMKLAIIPGYNVLVPQGRMTGGTFRSTPLCSRDGETNCIVAWTSFRERNTPPPGALFGYADIPGMTVGCVNPARFGSTAWQKLDSQWDTRSALPVPGGPITWSTEGNPPTAYVDTPGLASALCVNSGSRGYLSVRTNHSPGDKRTDRIGGEVGLFGMFLPGWGMHLSDLSLALGNLVEKVGAIGRSSTAK